MALGARIEDVVALVLRSGLRLTAAGAALGLIGAIALTRMLDTALPGLAGHAAGAVAAGGLVLAGVSVIACYLPSRRAARIDPLVAMRAE
jgi:ABC-type antimicrobial peptide transport system permease subunit